jgi:NIMA (never in mitosis gene a)-related kinase
MPLEDFEITGDLGKGSFGSVVKCIRRSDGEVYAMKQVLFTLTQIKLQKLKEKDKNNALNEIRFLASIHSPYVVEYKEAFYDEPS